MSPSPPAAFILFLPPMFAGYPRSRVRALRGARDGSRPRVRWPAALQGRSPRLRSAPPRSARLCSAWPSAIRIDRQRSRGQAAHSTLDADDRIDRGRACDSPKGLSPMLFLTDSATLKSYGCRPPRESAKWWADRLHKMTDNNGTAIRGQTSVNDDEWWGMNTNDDASSSWLLQHRSWREWTAIMKRHSEAQTLR